ncbi:hypothetical protein BGX27_006204 [Mortierella sp. AM989]|nr:hypothetical protein BGX27_006204 [Mortierella sp. AM989]
MSSKGIATGDTIYASQLFTRQELVGRGAYGAVYKGIENATQQVVAIKVLNLDTEEEDVSDIQREIATLSQLKNCDSQNITRYHGSFLNGTKLWIVMDYAAGGSIRSLLQALTKIDEKCIAVIAREVLQALGYLHKHGIIHRDIKAANILLTDEGRVQLCDFGVAGQVTMNSLKRNSFVGTPYWMAPEVIREGQTYDYKADIWSLGITIYEIATGNPPFADQDPMRAVSLIPKSRPAQLEGDWTPAMKEFVAFCLHEEPNERPSAEDLLKTKWFKNTSKNSIALLKDLVARYEQHKLDSALHKEETSSDIDIDHELESFDMEVDQEAWRFDTAKTVPAMAPSRASSVSRPSVDSKSEYTNGTKSPILSTQDSGVVMQSRSGKQSDLSQQKQDVSASTSTSATEISPTVKAKASLTSPESLKNRTTIKSQPTVISHESHPLLRLFLNHKSSSEEDVSMSPSLPSQGPHIASAPISLTIPNLEDITNARLASRSPIPNPDSNANLDHTHTSGQYSQHQHQSTTGNRPPETARIPFGFNMSKPFRFDRRPSAPILIGNGSTPGTDFPFQNQHMLNRGAASSSPLTSPRAVPLPTQPSILANMHSKQGAQDSDSSASLPPNKGSLSHEITISSHQQMSSNQGMRPNSTPASPAFPPIALVGSSSGPLNATNTALNNTLNSSKDAPRYNGQRRPSPTISSSLMMPNQQQLQQQHQQQQQQPRFPNDTRSNLPPAVPHRKASLDFSQIERHSHLRPSLPMRPPSAAAVRSSTFHGLDSVPIIGTAQSAAESTSNISTSFANSITGISSGLAALNMQPININEEKLPPFGHSAAHLRMINALPDNSSAPTHDKHRGSITSSDKDGMSPPSSVNSDPTFGQHHSSSLPNHAASLSSSSGSTASSTSVPNSVATNGNFSASGSGAVMARPGLRTVGSSESFARRIRSASMLRRNEDQDGFAKGGLQPSRPPHALAPFSGQQSQQPSVPLGHYHQHPGYQQQQYSYAHEPNSADIHRYRRASSPRRRSISMTNLNGGLSIILIPQKKNNADDYAANPLLLPPSPSTTRFIAPSSMAASAISSSPLRPALHSMPSSSSLSSSFGSISGAIAGHTSVGASNGAAYGNQQLVSGPPFVGHGSSSLSSSVPTNISTSPPSLPQVINNNFNSNHHSTTSSYSNNINTSANNTASSNTNAKSVMNITNTPYYQTNSYHSSSNVNLNASSVSHNVPTPSTLVASNSQQNISQHIGSYHHSQVQQQQQQQQNTPIQMLIVTPEPRPLQMDALRRNDDLIEELQMTVNDLSQWLEVFETGIKSVRSS